MHTFIIRVDTVKQIYCIRENTLIKRTNTIYFLIITRTDTMYYATE